MLYLLATPIGNISDITIRALEILEFCNDILCEDTRVSKKLISLLNSRNLLKNTDFNYISLHSHNEDFRIESLGLDFFNKNVALLSDAGMPCVSDPGARVVKFMQKNNLPYTIIPGCSSVLSAFALSGFETKEFKFLGFLPHKFHDKKTTLHKILKEKHINIFFESPKRILNTMEILSELAPKREIFLVKEITKLYEKYYFGTISDVFMQIKNINLNGEWVIVLRENTDIAESKTLDINDINELSIPPKIKAKILSKLTDKSVQDCYNEILKDEK